jgi:23S rRNA pseudouridine2605 synthase
MRLNRYIAQAGICARRKADELISEGRVRVNGEVVTQMGIRVSATDVVEVSGSRITPQAYEYVLLNKPANFITSNNDEKGRKTVHDLIEDPDIKDRGLFPVGRLDRNTVGILLLTNDGELAHRLMHPRYNIDKLYHVVTKSSVLPHQLEELRRGVTVDEESLALDDVEYINLPKKNELGIRLHEGKNRHIRRMLESVGHETVYLERVRYAGLSSEGIRRGKWRRLRPNEVKRLRRLVKLK